MGWVQVTINACLKNLKKILLLGTGAQLSLEAWVQQRMLMWWRRGSPKAGISGYWNPGIFFRGRLLNSTKPQTLWDIKKHHPTSKTKKQPKKKTKKNPQTPPCNPKLTGRLTLQLSSQRALTTSVKPWLTATYRAVHLALFSRSALAPLASSTRATSAWFLV